MDALAQSCALISEQVGLKPVRYFPSCSPLYGRDRVHPSASSPDAQSHVVRFSTALGLDRSASVRTPGQDKEERRGKQRESVLGDKSVAVILGSR